MRRPIVLVLLAACGGDDGIDLSKPQTFDFGPYALTPGQEVSNQCVSVTLNNEQPLFINAVEMTSGPGFHHSNWFWVPDHLFAGPDGQWNCDERGYDEAEAGFSGGVLFAQSTQLQHELQKFPDGVGLVVPPHARILAGTHLLNTTDEPQSVSISLTITPIADPTVKLSGVGFANQSLAIPPMRKSRFTMDCDVDSPHRNLFSRPVDFKFYYALAHYHDLGTGLSIEAVRTDGTTATIFSTTNRIGDALGGNIDAFDMTGFAKFRMSCDFDNPRTTVVRWGLGQKEMCAFLAFTNSERNWSGGILHYNAVPTITDDGTTMTYTFDDCVVFPSEATL